PRNTRFLFLLLLSLLLLFMFLLFLLIFLHSASRYAKSRGAPAQFVPAWQRLYTLPRLMMRMVYSCSTVGFQRHTQRSESAGSSSLVTGSPLASKTYTSISV